jgi:hyperosmotically inducible protein
MHKIFAAVAACGLLACASGDAQRRPTATAANAPAPNTVIGHRAGVEVRPVAISHESADEAEGQAQREAIAAGPGIDDIGIDRDARTPSAPGDRESDLTITRSIRRAVVADDSLSFNAKNVKIVTEAGQVTLRGAVKNTGESQAIETHARAVAGGGNVDNRLEIEN